MKAFAIIQNPGGTPNLNDANGDPLPYHGFVHQYQLAANWGTYLISGTAAQLTAIAALTTGIPVCVVSEGDQSRWPELDDVISAARRTRLNTWLTARGFPSVPVGWTYRRVLEAIYRRVKPDFNLMAEDVADA